MFKKKQRWAGSNDMPGRPRPIQHFAFSQPPRQYDGRDVMALDRLGGYYTRHVSAMTGESLHSKSEIAAELAWRDSEIDRLKAERSESEQAASAAIQFALQTDDGLEFLRAWAFGEYDTIQSDWPGCPEVAMHVIAGANEGNR